MVEIKNNIENGVVLAGALAPRAGAAYKFELLSDPGGDGCCGGPNCPAIFRGEGDSVLVRGYSADMITSQTIGTAPGEAIVSLPKEFILSAAAALKASLNKV